MQTSTIWSVWFVTRKIEPAAVESRDGTLDRYDIVVGGSVYWCWGLLGGDILLDGAVAPVDRHLHVAAEREAAPRRSEAVTFRPRISASKSKPDCETVITRSATLALPSPVVTVIVAEREAVSGLISAETLESGFSTGYREPVAAFGAGIAPLEVRIDRNLLGFGRSCRKGNGLQRSVEFGGTLLHHTDRLRSRRSAALTRDELEGDLAVFSHFVGIERQQNLVSVALDKQPGAAFGLETQSSSVDCTSNSAVSSRRREFGSCFWKQ